MRLGILTGDTGWGKEDNNATGDGYWHNAQEGSTHSDCGRVDVRGAVPSGPPPPGTPHCPYGC